MAQVYFRGRLAHNDALSLPPAQRAIVRNKTFQGIANAMAKQWGIDEKQRLEASGLLF